VAGARVAVTARSLDELDDTVRAIQTRGGPARALPADVTDQAAVESVVAEAERSLGAISLLVNNAGVLGPVGVIWEVDPEDWWRCIEVNLRGTFLYARAVLPRLIERRKGRIVSVASIAALVPIPDASAYGSSKAALVRFSESLAMEAAEFGIGVFSIDPGNVPTGMHAFLAESSAWLKRRGSHTPVFTPAQSAAELVARLASGQADALTGRLIHVHDDLDDLVQRADAIRKDDLYTLRLRR
jgi:NAD(P)-dependent dehydrogenase (short-subunit alcohol dehydrogenase family)